MTTTPITQVSINFLKNKNVLTTLFQFKYPTSFLFFFREALCLCAVIKLETKQKNIIFYLVINLDLQRRKKLFEYILIINCQWQHYRLLET